MKYSPFDWVSQTFQPPEAVQDDRERLALKATSVLIKHFLIPFADNEIASWRSNDHYRHHLSEIEERDSDMVWVKPWIVGEWVDDTPNIIRLNPTESPDQVFNESLAEAFAHLINKGKKNALFGIYLTVDRPEEQWSAVFAFLLDGGLHGKHLHDLPVRKALCLSVDGDEEKVERWLDWAYRENS